MSKQISPPSPEAPAPARRAVAWPLVLTAIVTWESVCAIPSLEAPWLSFDQLAHFGVFGLLATTIVRLERAGRWPLLGPLWAIVLVSVYGMAVEILQSFTPTRSMEYGDWVADTLGAALAVVLYLRWTRYRRLLEQPTGRRRRQPRVEISPEPVPNPPA
jgi:VanZ family protein